MPSIDHIHHNITMTMASTLYKMWLITLQSRYHYAHFIDKKIEAQQVQMCDSSIVDMFYKKNTASLCNVRDFKILDII